MFWDIQISMWRILCGLYYFELYWSLHVNSCFGLQCGRVRMLFLWTLNPRLEWKGLLEIHYFQCWGAMCNIWEIVGLGTNVLIFEAVHAFIFIVSVTWGFWIALGKNHLVQQRHTRGWEEAMLFIFGICQIAKGFKECMCGAWKFLSLMEVFQVSLCSGHLLHDHRR